MGSNKTVLSVSGDKALNHMNYGLIESMFELLLKS